MCAVINPELDRLARARYVSLTTYKRDGTPVATPVWVMSEGGFLQVITERSSGKVKRLARNAELQVAPCDFRGGLQGDAVAATAIVIDDPELLARAQDLLVRRYGLAGRFFLWLDRVRNRELVVLAIDVPMPAPPD